MPRFRRAEHRRTLYYFTVTGRGLFPIDMLRYDSAFPTTAEDAAQIVGHDFGADAPRGHRTIRLGCVQDGGPTIGRWESFNWSVGDPDRGEVG